MNLAGESSRRMIPTYYRKPNQKERKNQMEDKLLHQVRKNIIKINKQIESNQDNISSGYIVALSRLLSIYHKMNRMNESKKDKPKQSYYESVEKGLVKMKE